MNASISSTSSSSMDLSHHLSSETRLRKANPMKAIWRLTRRKADMISLANGKSSPRSHFLTTTKVITLFAGDPHFSLYPIKKMEFEVASVDDDNKKQSPSRQPHRSSRPYRRNATLALLAIACLSATRLSSRNIGNGPPAIL